MREADMPQAVYEAKAARLEEIRTTSTHYQPLGATCLLPPYSPLQPSL